MTDDGTVMAVTGWEHDAYDLARWPAELGKAYRRDPPIFEATLSEAARDMGRLAERLRTWPGATRSDHPEASFAAIGARAGWVTADQPWNHPYGRGSPLEKLVELDGRVLMLGAPLETVTLLHYAEELADVAEKRLVRYEVAIPSNGRIEWRTIEDIDTDEGAFPYRELVGDRDGFEVIACDALAAGIGTSGELGESTVHIFPARGLVEFAVRWIEERFGRRE